MEKNDKWSYGSSRYCNCNAGTWTYNGTGRREENIKGSFSVAQKQELIGLLETKVYIDKKWMRLKDAIEDLIDSYIGFLNEKSDDILKIDFSKGIRYGGE